MQGETYPGAYINSDHNPVIAKVRIKLKSTKAEKKEDNKHRSEERRVGKECRTR